MSFLSIGAASTAARVGEAPPGARQAQRKIRAPRSRRSSGAEAHAPGFLPARIASARRGCGQRDAHGKRTIRWSQVAIGAMQSRWCSAPRQVIRTARQRSVRARRFDARMMPTACGDRRTS